MIKSYRKFEGEKNIVCVSFDKNGGAGAGVDFIDC